MYMNIKCEKFTVQLAAKYMSCVYIFKITAEKPTAEESFNSRET